MKIGVGGHIMAPDGVVHRAVFLDAVYWRPACGIIPFTKPPGWKKNLEQMLTCLVCFAGPTREEIMLGFVHPIPEVAERNKQTKTPWKNPVTKLKRMTKGRT